MKKKIDKQFLGWGLTAFFVILASMICIYLIYNMSNVSAAFSRIVKICTPIIDGIILAFLLTPIMNMIENKILKPLLLRTGLKNYKKKDGLFRFFSILLTWILVIIAVSTFFRIIIPQLILSIQSIIFQFPNYINNLEIWVTDVLENNPDLSAIVDEGINLFSDKINNYIQTDLLPQINDIIRTLSLSVVGLFKALFNLIIGMIISIYLMGTKETLAGQAKKITFALFEANNANKIIKGARYSHSTFIGFISGKILDSVIIGVLCFIFTSIIGTPYAVLISCIVGITNVIPFFGPYFGAIPSALLVLMVNPIQCLYFIILILILQQIDGNIIGPKILGDSTGLSSFWVIFSITVFGGLMGVPGMIVGVPLFAVLYAGFKTFIYYLLKNKNLPIDTESYLKVGYIENNVFTEYVPQKRKKRNIEVIDIQAPVNINPDVNTVQVNTVEDLTNVIQEDLSNVIQEDSSNNTKNGDKK